MKKFSIDWWLKYQELWNQEQDLWSKFSGLGKVIFICDYNSDESISICLEWDKEGKIATVNSIDDLPEKSPTFRADEAMWQRFVDQEIKAAPAVMNGQIDYQGSLTLMIKYGKSFDNLALVAQKMSS